MRRFHSIESKRKREQRKRQAEAMGVRMQNFFSRSPHDCGRPRCGVCHSTPKGHPRQWLAWNPLEAKED